GTNYGARPPMKVCVLPPSVEQKPANGAPTYRNFRMSGNAAAVPPLPGSVPGSVSPNGKNWVPSATRPSESIPIPLVTEIAKLAARGAALTELLAIRPAIPPEVPEVTVT